MANPRQIDGIDVFIEGSGDHSIVMVHGWPDTHRLWDAQVAHLSANYRCIRFTLPGFDIGKPRRGYALAELVDTLKHIVEQTCPGQQVTLMLHDWGCIFGYEFAMRHPLLVRRIVGVDIGDVGSRVHLQSLSVKAKLMVVAYQVWLAIAWRIGGALGDKMTRWMARALRAPKRPALHRLCDVLPLLHPVDRRAWLIPQGAALRTDLADALHLGPQEALPVSLGAVGTGLAPAAGLPGAGIRYGALGDEEQTARVQ